MKKKGTRISPDPFSGAVYEKSYRHGTVGMVVPEAGRGGKGPPEEDRTTVDMP